MLLRSKHIDKQDSVISCMKFEWRFKSGYISGSGRKEQKIYLELYKNYPINQLVVWNNGLPVASFPRSQGEDILSLTLMNSGFHPWPSGYWISIIMGFRALFKSCELFPHAKPEPRSTLLSQPQIGFFSEFPLWKANPLQTVRSTQEKLHSSKPQTIKDYFPF